MIWLLRLAVVLVCAIPLYRSTRFYLSADGAYRPARYHQHRLGVGLWVLALGIAAALMFL